MIDNLKEPDQENPDLNTKEVTSAVTTGAILSASLLMGAGITIFSGSWSAFFALCGLTGGALLFSACSAKLMKAVRNRKLVDEFTTIHAFVVATVAIAGLLWVGGLVERILWSQANYVPGILIRKDYVSENIKFDVNQFRYTQLICKQRDSFIEIKEFDAIYYVRCGTFFPETYVVRVDKATFEKAAGEAASVEDGTPIMLTPLPKTSER